jgi:hypothetical protein
MFGARGRICQVRASCPISTMSSFSEDGASEISAFASIRLNDAFRRLPTNTHIFHYDISAPMFVPTRSLKI